MGLCLSIAFSFLLVCIVFASEATIHDGSAVRSLISVLAAAALAFTAASARAADVKFAGQAARGLKLAVALPAIWMAIQILPLPYGAHSIWNSANEALDRQSWGHISVDLGATILALAFYLANVSLVLVTLFVAKDRRRAELILFVLTGVTALATVVLLAGKWGLIPGLDATDDVRSAIGALGILLSLTSTVRAVERQESRRETATDQTENFHLALVASGISLLCCIGGLMTAWTLNVGLIVAFGVVVFGSVQIVRRVDLTGWATGVLVATTVVAAVMIIIWRYDALRTVSPFLQFVTERSSEAVSVTQRVLSDAGWRGTGAGTFSMLVPIYQYLGSSITTPPSTASAFAIELGWPMALVSIAITIGTIAVLYRGSLVRGRDSFYSAAAAACGMVMVGQAFCDASLLNSSVAVIGDAIIGLGLAQRLSARGSF